MTCRYSFDPAKRYDPYDELHLSPKSRDGLALIKESRKIYNEFANTYRHTLNLNFPDSVSITYEAAQNAGVFAFAHDVRKKFYAYDMHFYGVTYLWDICMESCVYCPAALQNRINTKYKPLAMPIAEAIKDIKYVMQDGHRHLCVLTGEEPRRYPPHILADYIRAFDELGLKEIILNVEPPADWDDFALWRNAAKKTALQFRVFQETYNKEKYAQIHPRTKFGRKHDFARRYSSQTMALNYGFDNVGIGVLFGNHHFPIEEIDALLEHAELLRNESGKYPARICLPSAKYLEQIQVEIPYSLESHNLYWKFSEIIYALARLALPFMNIVSSERDESSLLKILDNYATCTTLNVHPGVGDNIRFHENNVLKDIHFEQAPSYSRHPQTAINDWLARGYNPLIMSREN